MKQVWLLVFVFVSFNLLWSQRVRPAPTVEQCRADQRLWHDNVEFRESELPDYDTLSNWEVELWDCTSVDRDNRESYLETAYLVWGQQNARLESYMRRNSCSSGLVSGNGLWNDFYKDDKARYAPRRPTN